MTLMPDVSLRLVDSIEEAGRLLDWVAALPHRVPVGLDTETKGLEWWHADESFVRLLTIGTATQGWAIPVREYRAVANEVLTSCPAPFVLHNAKFDQHALDVSNLPVPPAYRIDDTQILSHLNNNVAKHGLKPTAGRLLGQWATVGEHSLKRMFSDTGYDWDTVPVDHPLYWGYGALDPVITVRVYEALYPTLNEQERRAYETELAYQDLMFRVERRGIRVDPAYSRQQAARLEHRNGELVSLLEDHGVSSAYANKQVESALRDLGWDPEEFTETGQAKLDKEIMLSLVEQYPDNKLIPTVMEYKHNHKLINSYFDCFSSEWVHPEVRCLGAKTGRSSIANPPMQQLPRDDQVVRSAILPLADDHRLWAVDYANQELRIFASYADETDMIREFTQGEGDLHSLVADVMHIPRRVAKTINFALIYGAGIGKMARTAGVSEGEMEHYLGIYKQRFPRVHPWMDKQQSQASVITSGGRTLYAEDDEGYKLTNYLIQGSGADVTKQALVRLDAAGYSDYIVLPVHDEVLFSLPEGCTAEEACGIMRDESFAIPLDTDQEGPFGTWGDKYDSAS